MRTWLDDALDLEEGEQAPLFERMIATSSPEELIKEIQQTVLRAPKKRLWPVAIRFFHYLGYPRNVLAVTNMVGLLVDGDWPGWEEAVAALKEIPPSVVAPYLIAIYLDQGHTRIYWEDDVYGVSRALLQLGDAYREPCLPALLFLLSQKDYDQQIWHENLDVFEGDLLSHHPEFLPALLSLLARTEHPEMQAHLTMLLNTVPESMLHLYHKTAWFPSFS